MSDIHICWRPPAQPATEFVVDVSDGLEPHTIRWKPYRLGRCESCQRMRRCANLSVIPTYAWLYVFCTDKAGCEQWRKDQRQRKRRDRR
jgi:hypothetical protein